MFKGSRMKNNIRFMVGKNAVDGLRVTDIGKNNVGCIEGD
jgi:hypothetical protein